MKSCIVSSAITITDVVKKLIQYPLVRPVLKSYDFNVAMWKAFVHDVSRSRTLRQDVAPLELTSLFRVSEEPEQSNDTNHSHPGELSRAAEIIQDENPQKLEKREDPSAEIRTRHIISACVLIIMLILGGVIFWAQVFAWVVGCLISMITGKIV